MKNLIGWTAALIAGFVMGGCNTVPVPDPGHSIYVKHGVDDRVEIRGGTASVQSQAAPAALPAAPVTGWVRIPDGTLVERASCVVGTRKWVTDPQWPGWAVQVECRTVGASQAPAAQPAPAPAAVTPTPAAAPTTTTDTSRTTVKRLPNGAVATYTTTAATSRAAPSEPCKDSSKKWVEVSNAVDPITMKRNQSFECK